MRKLRIALTAVATASMVLGTMGAAMADQSTGQWETRADFIFQLDKALNIQPVYPATPDFQDVPTSDPYYGYIEAAFQDGITNGITQGVFGPSLALTRAEAAKYLVIAFGAGAAAQNITSTSFGDNANIPTALVGYVGEAAALGLMKGFPDGDFHPGSNLTVTQEGYLISQLTTAMSSLTLKVSASASDVAPGQLVTLATSATSTSGTTVSNPLVTYSVTGTNAANALISGNTFVGSAAGDYTVEASSGTATATTTISVYGQPAALKVDAPTSIVANGVSTATVTVSVVDANGNVVANNTDAITLDATTTAVAGYPDGSNLTEDSGNVNAVAGVATFTLTAGTVAGATETLTADDSVLGGSADQQATITGSAQVPTSIAVSANEAYIEANDQNGADPITAVVNDQTGNPMLSGAYTVSFSVSGPANFAGSATAAGVYYGPSGPAGAATATLNDVQGDTGAITVTGSATGLTSGTASVTSVITGAPSQLALTGASSTDADTSASYTVTLEDSHGYPVNSNDSFTITDQHGTTVASGSFANSASAKESVSETTAGSYTLTAADTTDTSITKATAALTVTAGAATGFTLSPNYASFNTPSSAPDYGTDGGYTYLWTGNPTFTATAQLTDDHGNAVTTAGTSVYFVLCSDDNFGTATVNGAGQTTANLGGGSCGNVVTATTNSQGVATATVTAQPYSEDEYLLAASLSDSTGFGGELNSGVQRTPIVELEMQQPNGAINVSYTDPATNAQVANISANGANYVGSFKLVDNYGNPFSDDGGYVVVVTPSGAGSVSLSTDAADPYGSTVQPNADGTFTIYPDYNADGVMGANFYVNGGTAGNVTLTYQVYDELNATASTSTLAVTPGNQVTQVGFSYSGNAIGSGLDGAPNPLSVTAGSEYAITVTAEDAGGNAIVAPSTIPVSLDASQNGEFRLSASGTDVNTGLNTAVVDIPAGQTSATVYYIPGANVTSVYFSGEMVYDITSLDAGLHASPTPISATSTSDAITFTVMDGAGVTLSNVAVTFSVTTGGGASAGTLSTLTGVTGSDGTVTVKYTTPSSGWTTNGYNQIHVQVQGESGANGDTAYFQVNQ